MGEEKKDDVKENKEEKIEPVVLKIDMHCVGCSRKVRKFIKRFKGVEDVKIDMELSKVIVKGNVDPLKLCERVQKKCGRQTELLSPLPNKENKVEEEKEKKAEDLGKDKKPEPVVVTVVLKVHMHCEGCAQKVQRTILKLEGVQAVHSDFTNNKVTVKGTMEPKKLVAYVYKKTGKHAQIVLPPQKTGDETKKEDDKKAAEETKKDEDKKEEEKKDDGGDKKEGEEKKEEPKPDEKKEEPKPDEKKEEPKPDEKKEGEKSEEGEAKKDGEKVEGEEKKDAGDQPVKEEEKNNGGEETVVVNTVEEKKNEFSSPKYVIEHVYPPQLFSDENPNACSIM